MLSSFFSDLCEEYDAEHVEIVSDNARPHREYQKTKKATNMTKSQSMPAFNINRWGEEATPEMNMNRWGEAATAPPSQNSNFNRTLSLQRLDSNRGASLSKASVVGENKKSDMNSTWGLSNKKRNNSPASSTLNASWVSSPRKASNLSSNLLISRGDDISPSQKNFEYKLDAKRSGSRLSSSPGSNGSGLGEIRLTTKRNDMKTFDSSKFNINSRFASTPLRRSQPRVGAALKTNHTFLTRQGKSSRNQNAIMSNSLHSSKVYNNASVPQPQQTTSLTMLDEASMLESDMRPRMPTRDSPNGRPMQK